MQRYTVYLYLETKLNSVALVRERTIPTERPPPVGEVSANFWKLSGNCSTYFGWYFHPSSGAQTTVSTASGICHTVTAICHYGGRGGTGLSVLWVAYATHSTLRPVPILPP